MAAISSLCSHCLLFKDGRVQYLGETHTAVTAYLASSRGCEDTSLANRLDRKGSGALRFQAITLHDERGAPITAASSGATLTIRLHYEAHRPLRQVEAAIGIDDEMGTRLAHLYSAYCGADLNNIPSGGAIEFTIKRLPLVAASYKLTVFCTVHGEIADWVVDACRLDICDGDFFGSGKLVPPGQGSFLIRHSVGIATKSETAVAAPSP